MSENADSEAVDELVGVVADEVGVPMDFLAVAAFLESKGLRDVDAINDFGRPHIFALAKDIYDRVVATDTGTTPPERPADLKRWASFKRFVRLYIMGMLFAMPMTGQIIAVLVLRYNLWAYLDFTPMQASVVAIGTIASFSVTGGLVQAIGREGVFYSSQGNWVLLDRVNRRMIAAGLSGQALVTVAAIVGNILVPYFTPYQMGVMLLYFSLLTPLWLWLAVLYMLEAHAITLSVTVLGTGVVHLVMSLSNVGIHLAHGMGLLATNLFAIAYVWWTMRKRMKDVDTKYNLSKLPRPAVFVHIVKPFLCYGTLYFTFLFTDRMVGWTSSDTPLPLFFWFRTEYELGMDWALMSLVFTIAVLEYTIHEFGRVIIPYQQFFMSDQYKQHNDHFSAFYRGQRRMLTVFCVGSVFLVYFLGHALSQYDENSLVRDFFSSNVTWISFWGASVGYSLLAFGLLDSLFFFSLSRPWPVVRNLAVGLLVNLVVGYAMSRLGPYWLSLAGLMAGAGAFAYLMSKDARRLFRELDYVYYAAY